MPLIPTLLDPRVAVDSRVAPPPGFRPLGDVLVTRIAGSGFHGGVGKTVAQRAGIRYEAKVQKYIRRQVGNEWYREWPRLEVMGKGYVLRTLIPDGLYIYNDVATIIEIKRQHMPESWWQLRQLYEPAVKKISLISHVNLLTIVQSFDPAMPYPEPVERIFDVADFVQTPREFIGVLVWR